MEIKPEEIIQLDGSIEETFIYSLKFIKKELPDKEDIGEIVFYFNKDGCEKFKFKHQIIGIKDLEVQDTVTIPVPDSYTITTSSENVVIKHQIIIKG